MRLVFPSQVGGPVSNEDNKSSGPPPRPSTGTQPRVAGARSATGPRQQVADTLLSGDVAPPPAPAAPAPAAAPASAPAPAIGSGDPYIGTSVAGRYKVLGKLGEGGMGVVYLAEHVFIEKKVAIKILSEDFARKADLVARFMQEAKAASRIGHENIIDITDFGETASGSVFFVMEFLDGGDLAHHIRDTGPMPLSRTAYIMNQICRALGAAHSKGIIHRDLKPENIYLITREGNPDFVKILDFGIAKISSLDEGGSRLTRTGMIFGTPEYMSPEQARGDKPDHRVDIYAAGCILYEMLTGDVPFHAETFMGVLTKHMFEAPEPPSVRAPQANISPGVEAVALKALSKDREQRFQSMKELALALADAQGIELAGAWTSEGSGVRPVATTPSLSITTPTAAPASALAKGPARASRTPLYLGLAALGILAAGGIGYFATRKPPEPVVVAPKPAPAPKPIAIAPKPVALPPAAPQKSQLSFRSTPPEAELWSGPERIGVTPINLEYTRDTKPFEVTIKKRGFHDYRLTVAPDRNREYVVELTPLRRPERPSKSSKPAKQSSTSTATQSAKPEVKPAGKLRDLKDPFAN
ncbi:MAG TPA: serine/threonine-protein kinase [Polyangia bacterium]